METKADKDKGTRASGGLWASVFVSVRNETHDGETI